MPPSFAYTYSYVGCFQDRSLFGVLSTRDMPNIGMAPNRNSLTAANTEDAAVQCARICEGYQYFGLQSTDECFCDNTYGSLGLATSSDACGSCGIGLENCYDTNEVYSSTSAAPYVRAALVSHGRV